MMSDNITGLNVLVVGSITALCVFSVYKYYRNARHIDNLRNNHTTLRENAVRLITTYCNNNNTNTNTNTTYESLEKSKLVKGIHLMLVDEQGHVWVNSQVPSQARNQANKRPGINIKHTRPHFFNSVEKRARTGGGLVTLKDKENKNTNLIAYSVEYPERSGVDKILLLFMHE